MRMDLGLVIRRPILGLAIIVLCSVALSVKPRLLFGMPIDPAAVLIPFFVSVLVGAAIIYMIRRYVRQQESITELSALFELSSESLGIALDRISVLGDGSEPLSAQTCQFFGIDCTTKPTFSDLIDAIYPADRDRFLEHNAEFFDSPVQEGEVLKNQVEFRRRVSESEVRWVQASRILSRRNGRRVRFVIYKDIQSYKDSESRLSQIAENRADNLVTVSHEIRTPLNAIIGLSDLLLQTRLNKGQREHTEKIQTAADTLEAMIRNMLDLRRLDSGQLKVDAEEFDTESLFHKLATLHMASAERKGLRYLVDISPNLPRAICADQQMLMQVTSNLLRNAIKFTDKGMVMLSAGRCGAGLGSNLRQTEMLIEVSDTGVGIAANEQESIFDPYNRGVTRNKLEGAGLGLALVRRFVEALGGRVEVVSEPGVGSKFSVCIPVEVPDADPLIESELLAGIKALRVLIVERRQLVASHVNAVLSPYVKFVEFVDSIEAAKRMLGSVEFDVVLIGYVESESQAEQLKAEILEHTSSEPKIFVVSKTSNINAGFFSVFDAVILEPFTLKQLVQSLDQRREATLENTSVSPKGDLLPMLLLKRLNILVVEDNEINQRVISEQLRSYGAKLSLAGNGREAIDALLRDRYDLVLMDIEMPVMDGLTAAERIKSQSEWRDLPIIAVTAGITADQKARARDVGMTEFVGKPYKFDELYAAIERVLSVDPVEKVQADLFGDSADADDIEVVHHQTYSELNLELAQDYWPSSESLIENLELFIEKYPSADQLFTSEDPETNAKAAHTLKGAAGFLGMSGYSTKLSEFHEALKSGSATDTMLSDICQQHRHVIDEVSQFLSSLK